MIAVSQRNIDRGKPREYVKTVQRQQRQITLDVSTERLAQIKACIRNAERGRLPMVNGGADVTRPITEAQVQKFLDCEECQSNPVVFFPIQVDEGSERQERHNAMCGVMCSTLGEVVGHCYRMERSEMIPKTGSVCRFVFVCLS